jgi:hypothetical protein
VCNTVSHLEPACSNHGTCDPDLGNCSCARSHWGSFCEHDSLQTALREGVSGSVAFFALLAVGVVKGGRKGLLAAGKYTEGTEHVNPNLALTFANALAVWGLVNEFWAQSALAFNTLVPWPPEARAIESIFQIAIFDFKDNLFRYVTYSALLPPHAVPCRPLTSHFLQNLLLRIVCHCCCLWDVCRTAGDGGRTRATASATLGEAKIIRLPAVANPTVLFRSEPVDSRDLPNTAAGAQLQLSRLWAATSPRRPEHQVLDTRSLAVGRNGSGGRSVLHTVAAVGDATRI